MKISFWHGFQCKFRRFTYGNILWILLVKNLIKIPTCQKNPQNPSCIDLILTNSPLSFQSSGVIETGLSDFHKMAVTVMRTTFQKLGPKIIHYRDYRKYNNYSLRQDLLSTLVMENINLSNGLQKFIDIWMKSLDKFAPRKKKYSRGNNVHLWINYFPVLILKELG